MNQVQRNQFPFNAVMLVFIMIFPEIVRSRGKIRISTSCSSDCILSRTSPTFSNVLYQIWRSKATELNSETFAPYIKSCYIKKNFFISLFLFFLNFTYKLVLKIRLHAIVKIKEVITFRYIHTHTHIHFICEDDKVKVCAKRL